MFMDRAVESNVCYATPCDEGCWLALVGIPLETHNFAKQNVLSKRETKKWPLMGENRFGFSFSDSLSKASKTCCLSGCVQCIPLDAASFAY